LSGGQIPNSNISIFKKEISPSLLDFFYFPLDRKFKKEKYMNQNLIRTIYIDGGCSGNSRKDYSKRKMISVVCDSSNIILSEEEVNNGGSNNIAEFLALKDALKWCIQNKIKEIRIITDSKNTTYWFKKLKKGKQNNYKLVLQIRKEIMKLKKQVKVNLEWQPRETNLAGIYIENKYKL
jgi:ribonuclease HI